MCKTYHSNEELCLAKCRSSGSPDQEHCPEICDVLLKDSFPEADSQIDALSFGSLRLLHIKDGDSEIDWNINQDEGLKLASKHIDSIVDKLFTRDTMKDYFGVEHEVFQMSQAQLKTLIAGM